MINRAACGIVFTCATSLACVAEPEGIRKSPSSDPRDEIASAGESFGDSKAMLACDELAIVRDKCGRCHSSPPKHGAPFSLLSLDDLTSVDAKGVPRRERMADAIERRTMPARYLELDPPVAELSEEERDLLLAWLRGDDVERAARCD